MEKFTWVPIYKKLVKKIAEYKNNRQELLRIMYEILEELQLFHDEAEKGCNLDQFHGIRCKYDDFDPFSFLNRFNLFSVQNNKLFIQKFQEKTGLEVEVPSDFFGIPSPQKQKSCYIAFKDDRNPKDIDDLWDLFTVSIALAEEDSFIKREQFIALYNKAIEKPNCKFNISIGLFKIDPTYYLSLDSVNRKGLIEKYGFSISNYEPPTGERYLELIKRAKEVIEKDTSIDSMLDLSYKLWLGLEETEPAREEKIEKEKKNYFWLNTRPDEFSFRDKEVGYSKEFSSIGDKNKKPNFSIAKPGDSMLVYETTPVLQVIGIATISEKLANDNLMITLTHKLQTPVLYNQIKSQKELAGASFLTAPYGTLLSLTEEEYRCILKVLASSNPDMIYTWDDMDKEVFLEKKEYQTIIRLLFRKQNLILAGAPGVGKTYIVKKLLYTLMDFIEEERIGYVQFHQSYSYEDFVRGYRPREDGGYVLKDGLFLEFCEKARKNPSNDYYFVIDEINRGNLSKIFGELLMLIEKDKRESAFLKLAYQKEGESLFTVPKNVYILGLMNTADRSLANLDYALRRRFAFYEISPLFSTPKFKKYQEQYPPCFRRIIEAMEKLNERIADDESLGEGFKIGHSYFSNLKEASEEVLKDIITYEIQPILKEYWYDDSKKVETEVNTLLEALGNKND